MRDFEPMAAERQSRGLREDEGGLNQRATSSNELVERIRSEREMVSQRDDGSPESMPEVERELAMLVGSLHGVQQRTAELVVRLEAVLPPGGADLVTEAVQKASAVSRESRSMVPETQVGHRLRELQEQVHDVEVALGVLHNAIRL